MGSEKGKGESEREVDCGGDGFTLRLGRGVA